MRGRYLPSLVFSVFFAFLLGDGMELFITPLALAQDQILPLKIKAGEKAPGFALPSADGKIVRLSDYAGQIVLIDFYRGYW